MSSTPDEAWEAPVNVADEIEVAGAGTPDPDQAIEVDADPDLDLVDLDLDLALALGSSVQDEHSHPHPHPQPQPQQSQEVQTDDKNRGPDAGAGAGAGAGPDPIGEATTIVVDDNGIGNGTNHGIDHDDGTGHGAGSGIDNGTDNPHSNGDIEGDADSNGHRTRTSRAYSSSSRAGSGFGKDHDDEGRRGHERKGSEGGSSRHGNATPSASFPTHNSPRTWLLTQAVSPLAIRLIRLLLAHGDHVVACLPPLEIGLEDRGAEFRALIDECKSNRKDREGWRDRIRPIRCDGRSMAQCTATVAEAMELFGRIDILLCCNFEAVVGTVEELSTTPATQNLVRDQFETIFFSQVNFIKAALPKLRAQHTGHIIILTSIGGHIGTPGMPIHTAATWALEGFCDSLAYEIGPFNIKVTIVQPNKEIQSLTNKIILAPQLPWYESELNPAPSIRDILSNVLNVTAETVVEPSDTEIQHRYPQIPFYAIDKLVMETVHALTAIGGHENPPARHIVGFEGAVAVKEKLTTVTEELEDFVEASLAVDILESGMNADASHVKAPEPGDDSMDLAPA